MFKVIRPTSTLATAYTVPTEHIADRQKRATLVAKLGGTPVYSFVVDRGHIGGPEVHTVLDNAVIYISNQQTGRLITWLIGYPNQIRRYGITDETIIASAEKNRANGYSNYK